MIRICCLAAVLTSAVCCIVAAGEPEYHDFHIILAMAGGSLIGVYRSYRKHTPAKMIDPGSPSPKEVTRPLTDLPGRGWYESTGRLHL
jgi:hypothetical protein